MNHGQRGGLWALVSLFVLMAALLVGSANAQGQQPDAAGAAMKPGATPDAESSSKTDKPEKTPDYDNTLGPHLLRRFLWDQGAIWSSPARIRFADADWLLPFGLAMAGTLSSDTDFSKHLSSSPSRLSRSGSFSTDALVGMGGLAGGMYLWGHLMHDDHRKETGLLAAEAAANSLAVTYTLKYALQRERPLANDYQGDFWKSGDGFPSEHAAAAWSIASVIAHEYPGPLTEILAYGGASAISAARLTAKQHFPTDVLVGSALGWLSGEITYRNHHDPELGGASWPTFEESREFFEDDRPRKSMGTAFVELDSWVYPAFDRLVGLGYVHTSLAGQRPWTRMECARLLEEASEELPYGEAMSGAASVLIDELQSEFSYETRLLDGGRNVTADLESVYVRAVSISGPALTDGYHFGQTVSYDFGRPFERGTNGQAGGAFRAALGPLVIYVRAEEQHAPGAPAPSDAVRNIIALRDMVAEPPDVPVAPINRPQFLDAYVGVNLNNWQLLVGQQSLSWGPGVGGSLLWSDNAEPVNMVRLVNSEPIRLPGILKHLGPLRLDEFLGKLRDHPYTPHPYIFGQKVNFKPWSFLEFGVGRTSTIGGQGGDPLTFGNFVDLVFSRTSSTTEDHSIPGDSHSNLDWTFYVPRVHKYLVFYGEFYADDFHAFRTPKNNPYPYRPGIYLTRFPGIPKLDFHAEITSTEGPRT
ncbi:MAG: capsule assembly Wzi family protein, partial [Candidatus Acidiferrum sp.]